MNIKGLKLNKELIKLLFNSLDKIDESNLHGLEIFGNFSWGNFNGLEFKNLIILINKLIDEKMFDNISDNQKIIFNYSADVIELDIVTVLKYRDENILIDIESKNGTDENLNEKVIRQIEKRSNDHLLKFLKNRKFLTIGFANNEFQKAFYFDGLESKEIKTFNQLIELFRKFNDYSAVEEYLLNLSNLSSITKICKEIETGTYHYFSNTIDNYNYLISKINKEDAVLVYGNAGTGKSVLALKMFFENSNSKLLLLNSKFYYSLNFNKKYYSEKRATFKDEDFLNFIDKNTLSIIDECQRLPYEKIVEIIKKSKITYLFGDNRQAWINNGTAINSKELKQKLINENNFKVCIKTLNETLRYSEDVNKCLNLLTSRTKDYKDVKLPLDYEINLFYNEKQFLKFYRDKNEIKKIYVPTNQLNSCNLIIDNQVFKRADYNDDRFSVWDENENIYGTTYHALSFDIDHCFVFLKNITLIKQNGKQVVFWKKEYKQNEIDLFLNELHILFTRGKKSLNIFVSDIEVYLYLNKILMKIK